MPILGAVRRCASLIDDIDSSAYAAEDVFDLNRSRAEALQKVPSDLVEATPQSAATGSVQTGIDPIGATLIKGVHMSCGWWNGGHTWIMQTDSVLDTGQLLYKCYDCGDSKAMKPPPVKSGFRVLDREYGWRMALACGCSKTVRSDYDLSTCGSTTCHRHEAQFEVLNVVRLN